MNKDMEVLELACGFRVIIVIEANSYVNIRGSRLLPKFKTQKIKDYKKGDTDTNHQYLDIKFENDRLVIKVETKKYGMIFTVNL